MSHDFQFEGCMGDFKEAAKDFGEQMRGWAEEAGFSASNDPFGTAWGKSGPGRFSQVLYPRFNSYNIEGGDLVFEFVLPGYGQDAISISFVEDRMILKARSPLPAADEATRRYEVKRFQLRDIDRREYPVSAERYDQGAAAASYKDGILKVRIPRREGFTDSDGIRVDIVKEGN